MHALCLDAITAAEAGPPELVDLAAANGIPYIGLPVHRPTGRDWGITGDTQTRRETRRRCAATGVEVDIAESFLINSGVDVAAFREPLESAAWLGARRALVTTQDDDPGRLLDNFRQMCEIAEDCGLGVILEYSPRRTQKTAADAVRFLARLDRPEVQIVADALHTFRSGTPLDDLRHAGAMIGRAQICDGPATVGPAGGLHEALFDRMVPGDGELGLAEFLDALPGDIIVGMEVPLETMRSRGVTAAERIRRVTTATRELLGDRGQR